MDCQDDMTAAIQSLKDAGADLVIVSFHWGVEKENYPDETQQALAHAAIDQGADLVLGHHPHVLQGIEKYQENTLYTVSEISVSEAIRIHRTKTP